MKNLILLSYKYLPKSLLILLGSSVILKPIRDLLLRKNRRFIKAVVEIKRNYDSFHVSFDYCADLKSAAKAKYHGVEESILRKSIKIIQTRIPTNNAVVLDIGSNFGYLSLVWSQTIASENGIVFSFEPAKNVFEVFRETCLLNGKKVTNIKPINIAIGNEVGNIELKDFGTTSNVISQSYLSREKYTVPINTIDNFLTSTNLATLDLIKIDVDGIEYEILKGAKNTLLKFKPILIIETNDDQNILEFCRDLGYVVFDMNLEVYNNCDPLPPNIFCI